MNEYNEIDSIDDGDIGDIDDSDYLYNLRKTLIFVSVITLYLCFLTNNH